jgi:cytochrome c
MKLYRTRLLTLAMTTLSLACIAASAVPSLAHATTVAENTIKHAGAIERDGIKRSNELLNRAVLFLNKNGQDKAFAAFNDHKGNFVNQEYYVFVVEDNGILRASGGEPGWQIGLDVKDLHDAAGKNFIGDMLELAKSKDNGTVEYRWLNRFNNHIEVKTSQFRKVGKYLVCVGYYIPRASQEEATVLLNKAVTFLKKSGSASAYKTFNNPHGGFVIHDEYVFVLGLNDGKYRASGAAPQLTGHTMTTATDAAGKPIFKQMIELAKSKGEGTIDYVWRNPATNAVEQKHTLIQRVGDVLVGVGYYTKN